MPGRQYTSTAYRFGFNGKEKDDEVKGVGNSYSFDYRIFDPRLGRFLSVDPIGRKFAWNSPYSFAENKLGLGIELEGLELLPIHSSMFQMKYNGKEMTVKIVSENVPDAIKTPDGEGLLTHRGQVGTEGHDPVDNYNGPKIDDPNYNSPLPTPLYGDARDDEMPDIPESSSTKGIQSQKAEESTANKVFGSATEITRNFKNTVSLQRWLGADQEGQQRQAFYTATNTYNQFQQAVETGIPDNQKAQFKSDVINYVTDGTIPLPDVFTPKSDGTGKASYSTQQMNYAQRIIAAGNYIIGQIQGAKVSPETQKQNDILSSSTK